MAEHRVTYVLAVRLVDEFVEAAREWRRPQLALASRAGGEVGTVPSPPASGELNGQQHRETGGRELMAGNRGVAYIEPGKVEVHETDYPKLELLDGPGVNPANVGRKLNHGVILKVVTTNICGSDQHMVRGRTTAPPNLVLGHEILGEVVEKGSDVEFIDVGDICSVPFNIACGRCRNCRRARPGSASTSTLLVPARPTATSTWVAGSADRRSTSPCRTRTGTC
jgi:hypothetical protein